MRLINKLAGMVETSLDLDRVLHLALTCLTAGHAIGFNRAFVFLLDEERRHLVGRMAVGPASAAEARRIWADLASRDQTIEELLDSTRPSASDRGLSESVSAIRIPLSDHSDTLISTLQSRTCAYVGEARRDPHLRPEVAERLELEEFVCVPLAVQDEPIGLVLADNKYSRVPIGQHQLELLEMFARHASLAIANALAYERIRRQLDELRRTRDRLIEAERMASVGRMASHLAHEIRNPLTAIGGFARSIARRRRDDQKTCRNAMIIYEEARRLERTLVNVLDYTRPLRPRKRPIALNDIVLETLDQFKTQLREHEVTVRLELAEELPPVHADPEMLKQVIINLVRNAIEAMESKGGGTLAIATAADEGEVELVVADTGIGMEQKTLQSLFSPFFSTKIGGVGLGLSISQRIVRQHGGRIEVESELGEGTQFTVRLTVEPTGRADSEKGLPAEARKGGLANGEDIAR